MNQFTGRVVVYLVSTLILSFGAFYNWYPFITGDTAVYLQSGFEIYAPSERPIFYGLFLRYSSLGWSLWLSALTQSFILAYLLISLFKLVWHDIKDYQIYITLLLMGLSTALWAESAKLTPDIFTAVLTLACFLLFYKKNKNKSEWFGLGVLILLSIISHFSHLAIASVLLPGLLIYDLLKSRKLKKETLLFGILVTFAFLAIGISNKLSNNRFRIAEANDVFMLGKMNENGILETYLRDNCAKKELSLCAYIDSFPPTAWQFVWDKNSPLMRIGGWHQNQEEQTQIINDIFSKPKYLAMLAYKGIFATLVQLCQYACGDNLFRLEPDSNIIMAIEQYYPHEKNAALWTKQNLMEIPFASLSRFQLIVLLLTLMLYLWMRSVQKISPLSLHFIRFLFVMLILNAAVTANLANIAGRLNTRLLWLLPAFILFLAVKELVKYRTDKN